ncbi:hypothetical protein [Lentzea guizhouensis]|nr:hypothetical protein [Lentzea guizhouensis]
MTASPEPAVRVTEYTVSCLPQGHPQEHNFSLTVAERSPGRWAVQRYSSCYDADGNRGYEFVSTGRGDDFVARFRHSLDDALALASGSLRP